MIKIPDNIFKAYGIRGIYPTEINEENLEIIVQNIFDYIRKTISKDKITIVLGRDMRISASSLFETAKSTLERCGATIINVGLVSTPSFYYSVLKYKYDAGIQISASHNPKEYTGLKMVIRDENMLIKIGKTTGLEIIKDASLSGNIVDKKAGGSTQVNNSVLTDEVSDIMNDLDVKDLKPFKIVADPANAMGILYLEELFKNIPCKLVKMNFTLDGSFPSHQPDPLQFETLKELQMRVLQEKADLGIAPDGDGDRVFFITEKGEIIPATLITALISNEILKKNSKDKIIVDIRYTNNVKNVCAKYDSQVSISKVGHALITEQLNNENAAFAGESSGHFYFREHGGAESSLRLILMLLKIMSKRNKKVSEIVEENHTSFESGEFNFVLDETLNAQEILKSFETKYKDGQISNLDGLSIDFPEWRFNIRTSNTEPLMRVNVEANSKDLLDSNLDSILKMMTGFGAKKK